MKRSRKYKNDTVQLHLAPYRASMVPAKRARSGESVCPDRFCELLVRLTKSLSTLIRAVAQHVVPVSKMRKACFNPRESPRLACLAGVFAVNFYVFWSRGPACPGEDICSSSPHFFLNAPHTRPSLLLPGNKHMATGLIRRDETRRGTRILDRCGKWVRTASAGSGKWLAYVLKRLSQTHFIPTKKTNGGAVAPRSRHLTQDGAALL